MVGVCYYAWTKFVFAPHLQQEEEKRRQKIDMWDNIQHGKSNKGYRLSDVSFNFSFWKF